jgi:hypothetical protein
MPARTPNGSLLKRGGVALSTDSILHDHFILPPRLPPGQGPA